MEYVPHATTFLNKGRWSDVEGLKASPLAARAPTHHKPDPNCPKCQGEGFVTVDKGDGNRHSAVCSCRKINHGK